MNKAQRVSVERIRQNAALIEELVPVEEKRLSQQRRKAIVNAYETITSHAYKLGLSLPPRLSYLYNPTQYLDYTRSIVTQLQQYERGAAKK